MIKPIDHRRLPPLKPRPTGLKPRGQLDAPIGCILFDIYGTLFISASGDIGQARRLGLRLEKIEPLLRDLGIESSADIIVQRFLDAIEAEHQKLKRRGNAYPEVQIDQIWMAVLNLSTLDQARAFALEYELIVNPVYPMPHLGEMLEACRAADTVMGVISNAQFYTPYLFKWFLGADIQQLGIDPELTLLSYKYGCAKPCMQLFEIACNRLANRDIAPRQVLYLGNDMRNDIWPAARAGFKTALFAGDARSLRLREDHPQCRGLAPDLIVTDLNQIKAYL